MRKNLIVVALGFAFLLSGTATIAKASDNARREKSLYSRLGGKQSIKAVVDEFVSNVANDDRINRFFADTAKDPKRLEVFKAKLVSQICMASGGPCKYTGKDMTAAHKGMGISEADFNALVQDLIKALDKFHVGQREQGELLSALGGMKGQIVGQ